MTSTDETTGGPAKLHASPDAVSAIQKIGGNYYAEPEAVPREDVLRLAAPTVVAELRRLAPFMASSYDNRLLIDRAAELDLL